MEGQRGIGVRPSPGAEASGRRIAWELFISPGDAKLAAPEDGCTPPIICFDPANRFVIGANGIAKGGLARNSGGGIR
jgi:hypothetical protein